MSAMVICRYRLARRLSPSYSILAYPPTLRAMYFALCRTETDGLTEVTNFDRIINY